MNQTPPPTPPPPPTSLPPIYMPDGQKKAVGIAIAALVLGICGFIPWLGLLCGLTGIILGIIALAQGTSRKGLAVAGIVTGTAGPVLMIALVVAMVLPALNRAKEQARQTICQLNLNSISSSIFFYAADNNDAYPPNLQILIDTAAMPKKMLQCPSAKSGRDCDYFYFPPPKTEEGLYEIRLVMACDFKDNHKGKGRSVLFADGYTQWMSEQDFQTELQQTYNAAFAKALREAEGQ